MRRFGGTAPLPLAIARLPAPLRIPRLPALPGALGHRRTFTSTYSPQAIIPFKLHDIGEGITEVEMLKWKVVEGQKVDHFDDLCEVQSDKSTAELTSPSPGIVHSILVEEGDTVKVGQTLCEIRTEDEPGEEPPSETAPVEEATLSSNVSEIAGTEPATSATEVDHAEKISATMGQEAEVIQHSVEPDPEPAPEVQHRQFDIESGSHEPDTSTGVRFSGEAAILPSAPPPTHVHAEVPVQPRRQRSGSDTERRVLLSSPAVRTLAARLGVDLTEVEGSGDKGRILREDVERYASSSSPSSPSQVDEASALSAVDRSSIPETTRVEFGRTRKIMWKALGAQADVPHFGYSHTLDLTPLLPYLKAANPPPDTPSKGYMAADMPASLPRSRALSSGQKTTLLSFLVKAMILAMEEHPIMRAKVMKKDDEKWLEVRRDGIIGVAVSDPKYGLVTPSLPALSPSTSLSSITSHLAALRAQPTKPGPSANIVISSVGGLGEATGAMPVIPPGGPVAICAVGRATWEMEWKLRNGGMKLSAEDVEKGGMRAVLRAPVGWSGDHRVLEGAEVIAFTESWKRYLEEPWRWIKVDG